MANNLADRGVCKRERTIRALGVSQQELVLSFWKVCKRMQATLSFEGRGQFAGQIAANNARQVSSSFENIAAGLYYSLNKSVKIGVEVGKERYAQTLAVFHGGVARMLSAGHCGDVNQFTTDPTGEGIGTIISDSNFWDTLIINGSSGGRVFNNDPALEAQVSPIDVVPRLPAAQRKTMFLTFSADPANRFYGDQITTFAGVLDAANVAFAILPTPLGHSWAAVREQLPDVLGILAARMVKLGVFATT